VIRFLKTPKGLMTVVLVGLIVAAAFGPDGGRMWSGLAAAAVAGLLVDAPILRWRSGAWEFPSGALLTGLFIAMVLSPFERWWVPAVVTVCGIVAKYLVRTRSANVFNPAAIALVASFYLLDTGHSWWGALPDMSWWGVAALVATGVFITDRVNKVPLVLVFLGTYFALFTLFAFVGDPKVVVEIFREPDVNAVIFFACFILTDPPTSPVKYGDQVYCGVIVAAASVAIFATTGAVHYLLSGVLVGNVWEAWRRASSHRRRARVRAAQAAAAERSLHGVPSTAV
jgi:Na+-translocating ferredoxin:NAD+ oxidoreductase RnfD subunit